MPALRNAQAPADTTDPAKQLRRDFGQWLKAHRERRSITQARMAEILGLRYFTFVSQVENGLGRIPQDLYRPWAEALEVEAKDFAAMALAHLEPGLFEMLDLPPVDPARDPAP